MPRTQFSIFDDDGDGPEFYWWSRSIFFDARPGFTKPYRLHVCRPSSEPVFFDEEETAVVAVVAALAASTPLF